MIVSIYYACLLLIYMFILISVFFFTADTRAKILDADLVQCLSQALLNDSKSLHFDMTSEILRLWQELMMHGKCSRFNFSLHLLILS